MKWCGSFLKSSGPLFRRSINDSIFNELNTSSTWKKFLCIFFCIYTSVHACHIPILKPISRYRTVEKKHPEHSIELCQASDKISQNRSPRCPQRPRITQFLSINTQFFFLCRIRLKWFFSEFFVAFCRLSAVLFLGSFCLQTCPQANRCLIDLGGFQLQ